MWIDRDCEVAPLESLFLPKARVVPGSEVIFREEHRPGGQASNFSVFLNERLADLLIPVRIYLLNA
jgi:hypothetical protein